MDQTSAHITRLGLQRPYDFKRIIPLLLSLFGLAILLVFCGSISIFGYVRFGTASWYFLLYITLLLVGAGILRKRSVLSYGLICLATIELLLAFSTSILEKNGIG